MTLTKILDRLAGSEAQAFCVVDKKGRFQGLISVNDLRSVLALGENMGPLLLAGEIADPHPQWMSPKSPLTDALSIFGRSDVEAIPVLDPAEQDRVLGVIFRKQLFGLYRRHRLGSGLEESWEETVELRRRGKPATELLRGTRPAQTAAPKKNAPGKPTP
jgi:CBS domain containing-hemolysin-like protein